jgi:hypothetical protein
MSSIFLFLFRTLFRIEAVSYYQTEDDMSEIIFFLVFMDCPTAFMALFYFPIFFFLAIYVSLFGSFKFLPFKKL